MSAMATQTMRSSGFRHPVRITAVEPEKERLPIVGHIITDEDIGALQGVKMQPIQLSKVVKLLTDPHSALLYDRHLHVLCKVTQHYQQGFLMKDLVTVFKILNVCADRVDEAPIYITPMCEILQLVSLPYLKEKTSDEIEYEQIAIESIAQLGYLMRVPSTDVRLEICKTLESFYCGPSPKQNVQCLKANTMEYNQKIVEGSDIAETLVKSLALIETDTAVKLSVLNILQKLSRQSERNCSLMLAADAAYRLCARLMDSDSTGQLIFRSCDILWNLLQNGDTDKVAQQLDNITCVTQLRDAFIQQLTQGYSHYDRQLRNDLLVLATLVANLSPKSPFVEVGYAKQLVLFTTFQEVKSHNALVRHLKLMQNHEDFELKKLLINLMVVLSKDHAVIPLMSEGKLLLALFCYVKANEKITGPKEWTPAQFEEIQLHALSAISTLGPLMIDDYMTCQGSTRLLLLLEWCTGSDDFGGQGNSFHSVGGRGTKRSQMRYCLRLIRSMVSTGEEAVLQDLVDQGAIHQLTNILKTMVRRQAQDDAIDVEMQCDMLFILSSLCDGDMHRKELFGNQGVSIVVQYLKTDPKRLSSGLGHHRLMLAAVDCIWCGVVGCYISEDFFLEKEGVFLLIDMLEKCPKNMHNLVLGCLLDLSENPKAIPHINTWRGQGDISAAHLFCNIWRDEEKEIGVPRSETGAIADPKKPLMGTLQENQGVTPLPAHCPSQAIVDVSENMRAKLYALFCKIGFIELPGLSTEDHVTLTLIEHYLDFKLGEVWTEVISELDQEGVRPVTPDREALEAISRTLQDRAGHVVTVQKELLEAQDQQDLIEEQEYYAEIRENHRQKEKALRDFNDYVARTSNFGLLKAAKERQELSVEASRVQTNYKTADLFHATDMPKLHTTSKKTENDDSYTLGSFMQDSHRDWYSSSFISFNVHDSHTSRQQSSNSQVSSFISSSRSFPSSCTSNPSSYSSSLSNSASPPFSFYVPTTATYTVFDYPSQLHFDQSNCCLDSAFSGRHINVESTPLSLTGGPLVNYNPLTGTLHSTILPEEASTVPGENTSAQEDPMDSVPALEAAFTTLQSINRNDLVELKSFSKPPVAVKQMMSAICVMMDVRDSKGKLLTSWDASRKLLADPTFLIKALISYDKDNIAPHIMAKIRKDFCSQPTFTPEHMKNTSKAAFGLYQWVLAIEQYDRLLKA